MPAFTTEFFRPSLLGKARNLTFEELLAQITALNQRERIRANDDPAVILRQDAFQRFQNMDLITKVNFTLARPRQIRRLAPSVMGAIREIDEFNGVSASIEVTVGRERNTTLNRNAISTLLGARTEIGESLKDLSITGTTRGNDNLEGRTRVDVVDFINDRLLVRSEVERRGRGKRLDPNGCKVALRRAISTHEDYLRTYRG